MKLVCTRCTLLKFGENNFILAEIINIFLKSKMAAAAILDFGNFAFLTNRVDDSWYQVYAGEIWLESLHPCGNY